MIYSIVYRSKAEREFAEAALWYEAQQEGLGERFVREYDRTIEKLRERPDSFPVSHSKTHRARIDPFPYAILFLIEDGRVVITGVADLRRDPASWQITDE
jgi:plasmid stabilization system protein ParE